MYQPFFFASFACFCSCLQTRRVPVAEIASSNHDKTAPPYSQLTLLQTAKFHSLHECCNTYSFWRNTPFGLPYGEVGQSYDLAALSGRLVRTDSDTGPVCTGLRIWPGITVVAQCVEELIDQMRVRTTMAATLNE